MLKSILSKCFNCISPPKNLPQKEIPQKYLEHPHNDPVTVYRNYCYHNTSSFTLKGRSTFARILDIYDGDSISLAIFLFDGVYKFNCRLARIDTCEMTSKTTENKNRAIMARNRLAQLVGCKNINLFTDYSRKELRALLSDEIYIVWVKCGEFEKYGRLLCEVYLSRDADKSLSDILMEEKLAYLYDGGSKMTEAEQNAVMI